MTFSEYVSTLAMKEYLRYCKQHNIKPEVDVKVPKLCALVKPYPNDKNLKQTRASTTSPTK